MAERFFRWMFPDGGFDTTICDLEENFQEVVMEKGPVFLLSKQFTKWVLIANLFAWPAAYFVMSEWLKSFAYRINIGIWVFVLSGMLAVGIALLTVSFQALKAARANPIDSLHYE